MPHIKNLTVNQKNQCREINKHYILLQQHGIISTVPTAPSFHLYDYSGNEQKRAIDRFNSVERYLQEYEFFSKAHGVHYRDLKTVVPTFEEDSSDMPEEIAQPEKLPTEPPYLRKKFKECRAINRSYITLQQEGKIQQVPTAPSCVLKDYGSAIERDKAVTQYIDEYQTFLKNLMRASEPTEPDTEWTEDVLDNGSGLDFLWQLSETIDNAPLLPPTVSQERSISADTAYGTEDLYHKPPMRYRELPKTLSDLERLLEQDNTPEKSPALHTLTA